LKRFERTTSTDPLTFLTDKVPLKFIWNTDANIAQNLKLKNNVNTANLNAFFNIYWQPLVAKGLYHFFSVVLFQKIPPHLHSSGNFILASSYFPLKTFCLWDPGVALDIFWNCTFKA